MPHRLARDALAAFATDLARRAGAEPALTAFAERLAAVDCARPRAGPPAPLDHPAMAHLAPALAAAEGEPALLAAVRAVLPALGWYQIYRGGGGGIDPALAEGMLAAQIVGQAGIVAGDAARAGLFLLAPGIHYPLHTHGAQEIYYCLSGRLALQHSRAGAPFELTPGKLSVTPSNRLHCLTTGPDPVLMLYTWIGEVDSPNWWWSQDAGGSWRRACWERQPDGSWARTAEEPVTEAHIVQAEG